MSFELLPHTADIRMRIAGNSLEELFRDALRGMAAVQESRIKKQEAKVAQEIKLTASDATVLLIDFLSEVLVLSQEHHAVFSDVEFSKLTATDLSATVKGSPIEEFEEDIKAVTYHEAEVKKTPEGFEAMVIFDI